MPGIDNPNSVAASIVGQIKDLQKALKDLSVNRTFSPAGFHIGLTGLVVDGPTTLTGGVVGNLTATGTLQGTDIVLTSGGVNAFGGGVFGGAVSAASFSTSGSATVGGDINLTGDLYTPHGRATPVVSSYVVAYLNVDGRLGATPSSIRFKQDIQSADTAPLVDALLKLALVRFRYVEAVDTFGDAAAVELGTIAEYVDQTALSEYVYVDDEGRPQGINYERLTIPLIATVQSLDARIKALEQRLTALGG